MTRALLGRQGPSQDAFYKLFSYSSGRIKLHNHKGSENGSERDAQKPPSGGNMFLLWHTFNSGGTVGVLHPPAPVPSLSQEVEVRTGLCTWWGEDEGLQNIRQGNNTHDTIRFIHHHQPMDL